MDTFKAASPLLAVDMIVEVNRAIAERGLSRVGILGTQTVMETRFYGGVTSAEIVPPGGQDLLDVHQAYVTMAASGVATEAQRSVFNVASHRLFKDNGVQAILLGGTDLVLVYDGRTSDFPLIDCASIHADAIARLAIG
jgi:aspartate racemase